MTNRTQLLWIGLVITLFFGLTIAVIPRDAEFAEDERLSALRPTPDGVRATYLTLDDLGIPTDLRMSPFLDAEPLTGPLVLFRPDRSLTSGELKELLMWVEEGGALIYGARSSFLIPDPILDTLGLETSPLALDSAFVETFFTSLEPTEIAGKTAFPIDHPWTVGIDSIPGFAGVFQIDSIRAAEVGPEPGTTWSTLLETADGEPVALTVEWGEGRIVSFADVGPLQNGNVGESTFATLFVRAIADLRKPGETVYFDEFHQGFGSGGSVPRVVMGFLTRDSLGHTIFQLLLLGLAILFLVGQRFGAPVPSVVGRRRSPLEHIDALAEAYRQSEATRTTRELLITGLARRLNRPPPHDDEQMRRFLTGLAKASTGSQAADGVLEAWQDSEADPAELAHAIDHYLEEVNRR